ncbi:MAG: hypothetical protein A3F54_05545 [Candidatus Kerfeldbacteria bacterium RIFCSPHIGHO2_12_FULL_48_17]|uniref:Uncharacterized protein n=1 Tax=Candidatus Kerfeldbacteria bacterium RIFCSPHIGHO2_12_FULL_48_17 TaxID=1798542 RepID=A0A1G2B5U2_9BACT|nr:MAG: hypothetical protein A3F54_05545 [Candidatus Kerfeldbacteria bacterium RIFCSPHIGHO2_12_FULL_48_17]
MSKEHVLTKEYFDQAIQTLASKEYVDKAVQNVATKEYVHQTIQESFKDFGQVLMKIFATKEELNVLKIELKAEIQSNKEEILEEMRDMKDEILTSNDKTVQKMIKIEQEQTVTTHRMDRIETEHGARITTLEEYDRA